MAILNRIYCPGSTGNVSVPTCIHDPSKAIGALLIPKGKAYTPAEILDIQTTLVTAARNDLRKDRIFPIGPFVSMEDKSTEPTSQKYGYGDEVEIDQGKYLFRFQHRNGMCYHKQLINFAGAQGKHDMLLVDDNYAIIGTQRKGPTGEMMFAGISISQITVPKFKFSDGTKKAEYWIGFGLLDANQLNKNYAFIQCDFNPLDVVVGLMDVTLTNITTAALPAGQYKVAMLTGCDSTNFASLYSGQLTKNEFVVRNALTQNPVTIAAAQIDGTGATLTLDTTDPDYPAVGGQMTVSLVKPSLLTAVQIDGYESNTAVLTRLV